MRDTITRRSFFSSAAALPAAALAGSGRRVKAACKATGRPWTRFLATIPARRPVPTPAPEGGPYATWSPDELRVLGVYYDAIIRHVDSGLSFKEAQREVERIIMTPID